MRRTAKNPKEQQNIRQAQFHENNLAIPLEDIIEKQPYATPDTMEKIQGNSEITSIPKCENIYWLGSWTWSCVLLVPGIKH